MVHTTVFAAPSHATADSACPAKALDAAQRQHLAVQALAGSFTLTALAGQAGVSRKFVYQQVATAQQALEQAFAPPEPADDAVLYSLPVTKRWIRMVVLALLLHGHSSYRGVIAFCRDCLGYALSLGTVHNIVHAAVPLARQHNDQQRLDAVAIGLVDEIFQAGDPVLVGVDAASTYCFLLSQEDNREAVTWGVRLLESQDQGLNPAAFVADFGTGLRAGLTLAFPDVPCRGDAFHGLQTVNEVVSALETRAYEALARCDKLERQAAHKERCCGRRDRSLAQQLRNARPDADRAVALADDVAVLAYWLRDDVLALAGPCHAERQALYDFLVAELRARAVQDPRRLGPLCNFLANQRDQLLAFAAVLDRDLAALAADFDVAADTVRELLRCQTLSPFSQRRWQAEADLRCRLRERFYPLSVAVRQVADQTVRASSLVENLNSRLRHYFTLRRHLGPDYLALLQFYLNHRPFDRSDRPERVGKSPAQVLTGQEHPHWLALLGCAPFSRN